LLSSDTKRHIDAARDVLVGVAPNPTTQIDQITYALIYKFMDDMDQASVKAGGEASFFVGDLEKYAWSNLISTRMGNQEKMALYSEALNKFSEAKQLPELFRTIFRAAFLPYRSPETLGLFLKEISYFDYTHPEELGNAYEYLLSIMSSQGDAGQFRTPRHIIDFIVDVINPTKDDKVLDPACGTGGFLVSTYNHILEQHDRTDDPKKKEKPLTPDERKKLMSNLQGYDIDPTMVRIAQVNMYLHQFKNPQIFQYDSLTSEERWNDKYDVILANPPFMSPKGGIKPHNKFGISSNRSEALFVDYIVSHLKPKGRAGIIVPEGVIFKNDSAFKDLRKNLLSNGLYAVVSLPGGVFQPYSGVKTSILLLDNELSKSRTKIMFLNIAADGFDLGATKRVIERNDLPEALELLQKWSVGIEIESEISSFVSKEIIAGKSDFNLSGEKYKAGKNSNQSAWEMFALEDILDYEQPTKYIVESIDYDDSYSTPVLTAGKTFLLGKTNETSGIFKESLPVIIFDDFTTASKYVDFPFKVKSSAMKILHAKNERINIKYVYYAIQNLDFPINEHKRYWISEYSKLQIPLPPLDVQQQIVAELDGYAAIISGSRQIIENWKPKIDISHEWELEPLGNFAHCLNGFAFKSELYVNAGIRVIRITNVQNGYIKDDEPKYYPKKLETEISRYKLFENDLLVSLTGNVGRVALLPKSFLPAALNQRVACLRIMDESRILQKYLFYFLNQKSFELEAIGASSGVAQKNLSTEWLKNFKIPVPPVEVQLQLIEQIDAEASQVDFAKQLIETYESKIQKVVSSLWDI
jgi:type I restriction enzyme M protein